MKRAILHIGTHKTGTTALQNFLWDNTGPLLEQGICFPKLKDRYTTASKSRNGYFLVRHARDMATPDPIPERARIANEKNLASFEKAVKKFDTLLLSDESIWYHGAKNPTLWRIYRDELERLGIDEFTIIVYLRRQDDYASSLWNQRVKNAVKLTVPLAQYVNNAQLKASMDYYKVLCDIEDVFGKDNIIVRAFSRSSLVDGDIRNDFCSLIGVELDEGFVFRERVSNTSLSNNVVEIKRQANYSEAYRESEEDFLRRPMSRVSLLPDTADDIPLLSPKQRKEILDSYAAGNEKIAREYLGRDDGVLFSVPEQFPEAWEFESEAYLRDVVRLFTETLAEEHARILEGERHVKELEGQIKEWKKLEQRIHALETQVKVADAERRRKIAKLEKDVKSLKSRTDRLADGEGILSRVRRKLRRMKRDYEKNQARK